MKAVLIEQFGGPDALKIEDVPEPEPRNGQALVRLEAIGVNFIDIYHRTGLYPNPLPFTPGSEGAGIVEAVGPGVGEVKIGDRVAYAMGVGSYAEKALVPAWRLVRLPDSISTEYGAAVMLQGMTVHYLVRGSFAIQKGDSALVHAAAGGVGLLLVQIAKHLGAFVIGTVSTEEKAQLARRAGADEIIFYTKQNFLEETRRITAGKGVSVVYDSVGQSTFERSMECLKPRGYLVLFGQTSGPVSPFSPSLLSKGSYFLTRPSLGHYTATREELLNRANEVFEWVKSGAMKIRIDQAYPLEKASEAHQRLESRASTGKILLLP
jgi:NADPH:quinone reductase